MVDARTYHERTNHTPASVRSDPPTLDRSNRPVPAKRYVDLPTRPLGGIRSIQQPALATVANAVADPVPPGADRVGRLDRLAIATICHAATGITQTVERRGERVRFRAASCTGKLYHVDLYLVTADLPGLDAGVYHVDPETFSLDVLREGDHRGAIGGALGADGASGTSKVHVVLTSTWWRNAWKYRERTYRHAFWDAGTIVANLLAAAHALDRRAEVLTAFVDADVAELVGVDPAVEAPIALVGLGTGDAPDPRGTIDAIDPATEPLSRDPRDFPLIVEAWDQSAIDGADAATDWLDRCREAGGIDPQRPDAAAASGLDPVGPAVASARPLHRTIERRGSTREFADAGPTRRQVATVLDRALRGVPGDWNGGDADGPGYLDCYVLATGVDGLDDGAYHLDPRGMRIERLGPTSTDEKRHLALDQPWAGDAHVNVYLTATVDDVVAALGNRGYRLAQLEAGVTLGRLYLATAAHRTLGGTGLTFYDEAVSDALGRRAAGRLPMCLFAFGRVEG